MALNSTFWCKKDDHNDVVMVFTEATDMKDQHFVVYSELSGTGQRKIMPLYMFLNTFKECKKFGIGNKSEEK